MAFSAADKSQYDRMHYVSADDLFGQIQQLAAFAKEHASQAEACSQSCIPVLHKLLVLVCHEGIRGTDQAYGNLFAQVDYLCRKHRMAVGDRIAIQTMRRHSNRQQTLSHEELMYDIRALCLFVSAVFGVGIPFAVASLIPAANRPYEKSAHIDYRYIRCAVKTWDEQTITASIDQEQETGEVMVDYTADHLRYLKDMLHEGMQLNLLDCSSDDSQPILRVKPSLVVVEPDFLLDISSIARCFEQYSHHPLNYTLSRLAASISTQPILLGNLASSILDDTINATDGQQQDVNATIRKNFSQRVTAFCTCPDFNSAQFLQDARRQATNIRQAVDVLFDSFPRNKAILEPSFVCERLGIQGRVDLMTTDFQLLVEQKSGKNWNIETGRRDEHGSMMLEPNYVQLLLYYGVLHYNFHLSFDQVNMRLLYSKYAADKGLLVVNYLQPLFREAICLRNLIVAWELHIARHGFDSIIDLIQPETVNVKNLRDRFFLQWKLPELEKICQPLHALSPIERAYFCRMMTFVYREQRVGRLGAYEGTSSCSSDLWNMPLSQKLETGNIFIALTVAKREKSREEGGNDLITLDIPPQGDAFLPNFRKGDMVYLYHYEREPLCTESILYKGVLLEISTRQLVVALADGQQNPSIFVPQQPGCLYAVEHAPTDTSTLSIRSLYTFISAPADRRNLLLSQRKPRRDESLMLSRSYHPDYDEILLRAKQAQDYFLLVGPPGTGKTSMALRFIVEEELTSPATSLISPVKSLTSHPSPLTSKNSCLLLMSYTNRAVDEICDMLSRASFPYLRIGSEHRCDERFKDHLLSEAVGQHPRLDDMRRLLLSSPIIVGTTSTIAGHPELFALKHFSLTIVDEASQILEPDIVGLLALAGKFILIGDHKQLPAVVQQSADDSRVDDPQLQAIGLTDCRNSLFERLISSASPCDIGILRRQGRMHPTIAAFPNRMFYPHEHILPVPLPHQSEPEGDTPRVLFLPSQFCLSPGQSDQVNTDEARIVAEHLWRIYQEQGDAFDPHTTVGVIVPYRNQISVIRQELEKLIAPAEPSAIHPLQRISIDTVERYQGSQRDVIIFSFTVQRLYQLEFLTASCFVETDADGTRRIIDRKLNVVLTRARKQLILTGNPEILSLNPIFRELIRQYDHS